MNLFGKKKKHNSEEDFDEEEEIKEAENEDRRENRKLKRKLRDLNPENSKKRKEPVKPWGKKERLIVGIFFGLTTISATLMFLFSHEFKFPGLPKITIKNVNLINPFSAEIIEIGQKEKSTKDDFRSQNAINKFKEDIKPLSGFYGFYVIRLTDGTGYGVSTNSSFQGASLLKLPLMALAFKKSEQGSFNLDREYILKESDKVKGSGILFNQKAGTSYTYRKLVEYMGKDSDRTAYKIIKGAIGEDEFKNFIKQSGMQNTDIETGNTTPTNIGILWQKIWSDEFLNESDKNELLGYLTNTIYEKWITAGVPKDVTVAHKIGQDLSVMADAGIVEAESPYVIVIMGNGITQHEADILFPKVSKDIYEIENSDK